MAVLTFSSTCLVLAAGSLAGVINSVAAGGSFVCFPALIFAGLPPLNANATNNTIAWMGHLATIYAYRSEPTIPFRQLIALILISTIGSLLGVILVLRTSQHLFNKLVPYLLLVATIIFAFGSRISRWLESYHLRETNASLLNSLSPFLNIMLVGTLQLIIAIYGGFFGAGSGIMMLAIFRLFKMKNIHCMNALKATLNAYINGVAMIAFIATNMIDWQTAFVMSCGTFFGSYCGAYVARQLDPKLVRTFVIVVSFGLTIHFFAKSIQCRFIFT